jgi:hypothetical protein
LPIRLETGDSSKEDGGGAPVDGRFDSSLPVLPSFLKRGFLMIEKCPLCEKKTKTYKRLLNHIRHEHPGRMGRLTVREAHRIVEDSRK